jgi:hypothetical protein
VAGKQASARGDSGPPAQPSAAALVAMHLQVFVSSLLWSVANPHGLRQFLRQQFGGIAAARRGLALRQAPARLLLRLPFDGCWTVFNGSVYKAGSHSWTILPQRYAYDFLVQDESGRRWKGDPSEPRSYFAYGQPVLAAADGEVVACRADLPDAPRAGSGWLDWRCRDIRGNYVLIEHGEGCCTLYAHLAPGCVCVAAGQRVRAGEPVGRCGHSGHSTEPHLHFQLQLGREFESALGLPAWFGGFWRQPESGEAASVARGCLRRGERVRPLAAAERQAAADRWVDEPAPQPAAVGRSELLRQAAMALLTLLGLGVVAIRLAEWVLLRLT